jgi:hypothetical protein
MGSALPALGLPSRADMYAAALEGLVQVNGLVLDKLPGLPPLYGAGVRWRAIPHDTWRRVDQIAGEGWGDCEGLSAWRVAELRGTGEDPLSRVGVYHTGPRKYHAIVIRGTDDIEDPSVLLGMRVRPRMPLTRADMNVINGMWPMDVRRRRPPSIVIGQDDGEAPGMAVDSVELPEGPAAQIKIPLADGQAIIATTSPAIDKAVAAAKGANLLADTAATIARNPMILAKLNPYAAAAVIAYSQPDIRRGLKKLGSSAQGLLRRFF